MANIVFYEKPGCINNTKQKAMLIDAGHKLEAKNLLTTSWSKETLRPFFGDLPIEKWFNRTAPRIKSGEVIPEKLDETTALNLMIADPILIRRPLIQVENVRQVGFEPEKINTWIGLKPQQKPQEDLENCPRTHQTTPCKTL